MQAAGVLGLQLLTFLLVAATLAGVTVSCRAVSQRGAWVPLTVAWLLVPRITPRPHLASWAVLAVCLALCLYALQRGPRWRLACLPLIALGSNLHAGAIFSTVIVGAFCLDAAWREKAWKRELAIGAGAALALMANPGGPYNVWYALTHLKLYDMVPIQELQTPGLTELPAFWASLLPVIALAIVCRKKAPALLLGAVLFALAGAFAARLAFKYYVVAAPVLALGAELLETRAARFVPAAFLALALSTNVGRYLGLELSPRWDEHQVPTRALEFVTAQQLGGRFYNSLGDGGFLAWARPDVPVFQDARMLAYSPAFFRAQLATEHSPERFEALMDDWKVDWALTSATRGSMTGNGLLGDQRWALVYWDDANELRVRRPSPLEALEFRTVRPDRDVEQIVRDLRAADDAQLPRLRSELDRVQRAGMAAGPASLFQCVLGLRAEGRRGPACSAVPEGWKGLIGTEG